MNIYFISGLGADERAFSKLDFVLQHKAIYLPWLPITSKSESIENYASRMAKDVLGPDPILVGLSFGGMMAMEIAKLIPVKKVILISSCKTKNELPTQLKLAGTLGLDHLIPSSLVKKSKPIIYNFLGTISEPEKQIASEYVDNIDDEYLAWSFRTISRWRNTDVACPTFHIHGNADMLLPSSFVKADVIIEGGNHFMIYNKAAEINPVINNVLAQL